MKEAMSQPSEPHTEAIKSSQQSSETELEEGSTASEDDTFLSVQFPSPPNFHTPYLRNWDFLRYPDLSKDIIYHNTFVSPEHFESLQRYINKSICDRNAALQIWSANIARYLVSDDLNPLLILNIL